MVHAATKLGRQSPGSRGSVLGLPYLTLDNLGTRTKRRDQRVARVRNSARLLASIAGDGGWEARIGAEMDDGAPVSPLLSAHVWHAVFAPEQIKNVAALVEAHVTAHGWLTKRHASHPTTDFSLRDTPPLWAVCAPIVAELVLPALHAAFFGAAVGAGAVLAINDLFYVRYDADTAGAQRALEAHRDGSLLSFSIAMSAPASFEGGGTLFVGSGKLLRPECAGDLVAHSGKILHAGEAVTAGVRDILVGFVTVTGPAVVRHCVYQ